MFVVNDLILRARSSLSGTKRPKTIFLRRAVSDAYYSLFHALAFLCADTLVGVTKRNSVSWRRVYRSLEHGRAKSELQRSDVRSLDVGIARIASAFVQLQEERHKADYDPAFTLRRRTDVEQWILLAEAANVDVNALSEELKIELVTTLIFKSRP